MNQDITRTTAWWRWPLVPLASILAATLGAIIVSMIQEFAVSFLDGYARDSAFHIYLFPLLPCALGGYLLAGTASRIAPSARITAGIVMSAFIGFVLLAFTVFTWTAGVPHNDAMQVTVASLAAVGGAIVALLQGREER